MTRLSITALAAMVATSALATPTVLAQQASPTPVLVRPQAFLQAVPVKQNYEGWTVDVFRKDIFAGFLFPNGPQNRDGMQRLKMTPQEFGVHPTVVQHQGDFVQLRTRAGRLVWLRVADVQLRRPPAMSEPNPQPNAPVRAPARTVIVAPSKPVTAPTRGIPTAPPPPVIAQPQLPMQGSVPEPMETRSLEIEPGGLADVASLEIVTDLLTPDQDYRPAAGDLPRGVVLLSRQSFQRNALLCDAFTRKLRTHTEALAEAPDKDFFVTSWLLAFGVADTESCAELMNAYDYDRASDIKQAFGLQDAEGPVLLAVDDNGDSVFLDLSGADDAHVSTAITQWLSLALDASDTDAVLVEDGAPPIAPFGDNSAVDPRDPEQSALGGEAEAATAASAEGEEPEPRFTLANLMSGLNKRLLGDQDHELTPISLDDSENETGVQLFAYEDINTGYRIGSTIRF